MKLLRYGLNGHIHDLSAELRNISEEVLLPFSPDRLKRLDMNSLPFVAGEPRVGRVGKSICIGFAGTEVR
jgi:ureidoglycolate lyase/2,4-diketo-3-deoxy-L-fuconate hydrolase